MFKFDIDIYIILWQSVLIFLATFSEYAQKILVFRKKILSFVFSIKPRSFFLPT